MMTTTLIDMKQQQTVVHQMRAKEGKTRKVKKKNIKRKTITMKARNQTNSYHKQLMMKRLLSQQQKYHLK